MNEDTLELIYGEIQPRWIEWWLREWEKARGHPEVRQPWVVIKANTLLHEWRYNLETGQTHPKVIQTMVDICVRNWMLYEINTIMFGHTPSSPYGFMECYLSEDWDADDLEAWTEDIDIWACDERGRWRISDFALDKIGALVIQMLETEDGGTRLYLIDQLLNVVHRRSDLAASFVEGGSATCSQLFEMEGDHA